MRRYRRRPALADLTDIAVTAAPADSPDLEQKEIEAHAGRSPGPGDLGDRPPSRHGHRADTADNADNAAGRGSECTQPSFIRQMRRDPHEQHASFTRDAAAAAYANVAVGWAP